MYNVNTTVETVEDDYDYDEIDVSDLYGFTMFEQIKAEIKAGKHDFEFAKLDIAIHNRKQQEALEEYRRNKDTYVRNKPDYSYLYPEKTTSSKSQSTTTRTATTSKKSTYRPSKSSYDAKRSVEMARKAGVSSSRIIKSTSELDAWILGK